MDLVAVVDAGGIVRYAGTTQPAADGYPTRDMFGHPLSDVLREEDAASVAHLVTDGREGHAATATVHLRLLDGSWRAYEAVASPLPACPHVGWRVVTFRDLTDQRRTEARLHEVETGFRTLVEQTPAVVYVTTVDPPGLMRYVSPYLETLLGYTMTAWQDDPGLWLKRLHPDDRDRVVAASAQARRTGEPFSLEYRVLARDGRVVWVQDDMVVVRDAAGRPQAWQGVLVDITARKRAEGLLSGQAQVLERIAAGAPLASILELLVRLADEQAGGARCTIFLVDPAGESLHLAATPSLPGSDRQTCWTTPIRSSTGQLLGAVALDVGRSRVPSDADQCLADLVVQLARIAIERQQTADRLTHQAFHDALTDLPNRALFEDRLAQALARAARRQRSVAVLFLDIDDFKAINDRWGHEMGDRVLRMIADRLRACVRAEDTVARLGGDEFVLLVEDERDDQRAQHVAARIHEQFRRPFELDGQEVVLTPSIGVAQNRSGADQPGNLVRAADLAMYAAKHRARAPGVVSRIRPGSHVPHGG